MWFDAYIENGRLSKEGRAKLADLAVAALKDDNLTVEYTPEIEAALLDDYVDGEGLRRMSEPPHYHCWHFIERRTDNPKDGTHGVTIDRCCTCGVYRSREFSYEIPPEHGRFAPQKEWITTFIGAPEIWTPYPQKLGKK